MFRTDSHNNPTAFTTDLAREAGLSENVDFSQGDSFQEIDHISGTVLHTFYTARLLGDPIETTIRLINKVGFYTKLGQVRWIYIAIPFWIWTTLDPTTKRKVIGFMYQHEGGTELRGLFK